MLKQKYYVGKVSQCIRNKGWFFGHFMDNELLKSDLVEVAWQGVPNKPADPQDEHYHQHSIEINIVISGQVQLNIDGQDFTIEAGEFYVIYPQVTVKNVKTSDHAQIIVIRAPSILGDKIHT